MRGVSFFNNVKQTMTETHEHKELRDDGGNYIIHIDNFDGPLDLLWDLIKRSKIDITDVSISRITEQYIEYLRIMDRMNVGIAADFIRMASELLYFKSRALLPSAQIEDEYFVHPLPPELVQRLLEFKKFQSISRRLLEEYKAGQDKFARVNIDDGPAGPDDFIELSLFDLLKAFAEVMETVGDNEEKEIVFDEILVSDRMEAIKELLRGREFLYFADIFSTRPSRMEIVVSFMAVLELARVKTVRLLQHTIYGTIRIMNLNGKNEK
jgi:segregation and condensation protein A